MRLWSNIVLYAMNAYLISSISIHQKVCDADTGQAATLRTVATLFIGEAQDRAIANAPVATGHCIECELCGHTLPDEKCRYPCYAQIKMNIEAPRHNTNMNIACKQDIDRGTESAAGRGDDDEKG